jgi:hypothetical protein
LAKPGPEGQGLSGATCLCQKGEGLPTLGGGVKKLFMKRFIGFSQGHENSIFVAKLAN